MSKINFCAVCLPTLLCAILTFSCDAPEERHYDVLVNTVTIPIGDSLLSDYFQYSFLENTTKHQYVLGYNNQLSQLDIFDLSNRRFVKTVPLQDEGPNAVNSILNAHFITLDSILLVGSFELYILNKFGDVTIKRSLNIPSRDRNINKDRDYLIMPFVSNINPIRKGTKVYLGKFPYSSQFEKNFFVEYNIATQEIYDIKMFYPDFLQKSPGQYKHKWTPQVEWLNDKFYYSFPATSHIWTYNPKKNETTEYKIKSTFNREFADPMGDFPKLGEIDYKYTELEYLRLHILNRSKQIIRIHRTRRTDPETNWEFYLMVMDFDLNLLAEFKIENANHLFPYQAFSDDEGVYIPIKSEFVGEEQLSFNYLRVTPTH